jgi:hypothetical protein
MQETVNVGISTKEPWNHTRALVIVQNVMRKC